MPRPPAQRHTHKLELSDDLLEKIDDIGKASLGGKAISALGARAPDLFLLGGGFFLGYVMNMRPGLDIPLIGFLGFPDFGGRVKELQKLVDTAESEVAKEKAQLVANDEEEARCIEQANERFLQHRDSLRLGADTLRCQERNISRTRLADVARLKGDLLKHRISQGLLMATMVFAFTRPGFLQGIGEIIPG